MRNLQKLTNVLFITFLTLTLLAGCGGGGGGGGEETADPGYTGVRTQAVIDDSNAQQLALDAYSGYTTAEPIVAPLSIDSSPNRQFAPLARVLYKSLPAFDFAPTPAPLAVYDEPGICGGTATVNYNEGTTTVSGSIVYNNYCDSGIVLNGTITFAGSYDPQTDDVSLTLDTSGLSDGASYVSGSISLQFNINDSFAPISLSMDLILTDALAHTYWVKDYSLVITPGSTFDTVNFSGTFYDYDAGYVVVTTTNPLQVNNFTGIMESGTLHFQGAQGTYADLTATGGGDYTLVVSTGSKYAGTF